VYATEISNQELNVTCVDAGFLTAVVMLKLRWWRVGNGSVISVDREPQTARGENNCRMLYFKLTI
jgi:hypothetical protein